MIMIQKLKAEMSKDEPTLWQIKRNGVGFEFGKAYLTSLERSAPVDNVVTFSGALQGVGAHCVDSAFLSGAVDDRLCAL